MKSLTNLHIQGYRRLFDVDLEVRPLTVMVGSNGVGKSSIIEILNLLSQSAKGNLSSEISSLGGINSVLTRSIADKIFINTKVNAPTLDYSLEISRVGNGFEIQHEGLNKVHALAFRSFLTSIELYHFLDVSRRAPIKTPQPMQPAVNPGKNGEDLAFQPTTNRPRPI
jgi:predicted ATPase